MTPGALCSHNIDLKDHLGGALNNLRFSDRLWEAEWLARSDLYANRLRSIEICEHFIGAGFELLKVEVARRATLATPRRVLAPHFQAMSDDDLLATRMLLVGRRPLRTD